MTDNAALFVGPSWVGDMVMAQSAFKAYASKNPGVAIDVAAPAWSLPVIARMPEIRQGYALKTGHGEFGWGTRRILARELQAQSYSHAVVLPRSLKSALVPWMAGIPRRTGFRGEFRYRLINDILPFDRGILDQTVKRFVFLATASEQDIRHVQYPELRVDKDNQRRLFDALGLVHDKPVVAMMPGAEYGPAKCWPLEHFGQLGIRLNEEGYAVWIFGSDKDRASGDAIARHCPQAENLCGRTSLEDVIDLLGHATVAVSNDSGLMHVAAAVGCQVHAIYGSSSPHFTPPLTENRKIHYKALECSPCFARECPLGHLNCLRDIGPEELFAAIRQKS